MTITVDGTAAEILVSKILMVVEIMTKHYRGQFWGIQYHYLHTYWCTVNATATEHQPV